MKGMVVLEDGAVFPGQVFGAYGEKTGEVVFNTSMTGYQEILTDPSYKGQIVTMTYPLIGNYGLNEEDIESSCPWVEGFIVKERSRIFSNWRGKWSLEEWLKKKGIMGIEGVDTRSLTRHIREKGAMKGIISTLTRDEKTLRQKAKASPGLVGRDLVKEVGCRKPYRWPGEESSLKVVVIDCGVKFNILRILSSAGCQVTVVPANTKAREILSLNPDGILLSNGPGDPEGVPYVIETVRELVEESGKRPLAIMGICLGHQILALALGGRTYKLKFGHHGGNHPVKELETDKISITVQNHGFCVEMMEDKGDGCRIAGNDEVEVTHINLNDGTCEGMKHRRLPVFSVQYHPEASPGPHDSRHLFQRFLEMMGGRNGS